MRILNVITWLIATLLASVMILIGVQELIALVTAHFGGEPLVIGHVLLLSHDRFLSNAGDTDSLLMIAFGAGTAWIIRRHYVSAIRRATRREMREVIDSIVRPVVETSLEEVRRELPTVLRKAVADNKVVTGSDIEAILDVLRHARDTIDASSKEAVKAARSTIEDARRTQQLLENAESVVAGAETRFSQVTDALITQAALVLTALRGDDSAREEVLHTAAMLETPCVDLPPRLLTRIGVVVEEYRDKKDADNLSDTMNVLAELLIDTYEEYMEKVQESPTYLAWLLLIFAEVRGALGKKDGKELQRLAKDLEPWRSPKPFPVTKV